MVARFLAPAFTIAVTLWHFSSLPTCGATAGHPVFRSNEERHIVLRFPFLIFSKAHVHLRESVFALAYVCMLFYKRRSNDKMSCDQ